MARPLLRLGSLVRPGAGLLLQGDPQGRPHLRVQQRRQRRALRAERRDGGSSITRLGGGPNGETLVGDNERALQLYYFKHDISEPVPEPPPPAPPAPPPYKFSGLMFGDYYYFEEDHLPAFEDQHGLWFRRMYFTFDYTFSPKLMTRFRLETNSNGKLQGGADHAVRQGRLPALERVRGAEFHARHPAVADVRLHRELLGPAAHREDAARPLPLGLVARHRPHPGWADQPEADPQVRGPVRQRVGQQRRDRQVQGLARLDPVRAARPDRRGSPPS